MKPAGTESFEGELQWGGASSRAPIRKLEVQQRHSGHRGQAWRRRSLSRLAGSPLQPVQDITRRPTFATLSVSCPLTWPFRYVYKVDTSCFTVYLDSRRIGMKRLGMVQGSPDLKWSVERRLEFIEFRLYWEGGINRADITDRFGVSVPQASKDLSLYQELAPGNMKYDKSEKRYFTAPRFTSRFPRPDPDQYLSQLQAIAADAVRADETWISKMPEVDSLAVLHRRVDPEFLRILLEAIRKEEAVEILYQSMNPNRPDPVWRGISPHAFANDGFRWHVRAFCHVDHRFKDFLLSRCLEFRSAGEALERSSSDKEWGEFYDMELVPNPMLSKSQQNAIAQDFDMVNGKLNISIRKSLFFYFEKRLRVDVAQVLDNPQEAPIVIANREDFNTHGHIVSTKPITGA